MAFWEAEGFGVETWLDGVFPIKMKGANREIGQV